MKAVRKALKYLGYAIGGIVVYVLAQEYAWIGYACGAALVGVALHEIVKEAVRAVLWEELRTLREQSYTNKERIETIDRKVSAMWDRIRQISGERS